MHSLLWLEKRKIFKVRSEILKVIRARQRFRSYISPLRGSFFVFKELSLVIKITFHLLILRTFQPLRKLGKYGTDSGVEMLRINVKAKM